MTYFKSVKKHWKSLLWFTLLTMAMPTFMTAGVGEHKQWVLDIFVTPFWSYVGVACGAGLAAFALFSFLHWVSDPE